MNIGGWDGVVGWMIRVVVVDRRSCTHAACATQVMKMMVLPMISSIVLSFLARLAVVKLYAVYGLHCHKLAHDLGNNGQGTSRLCGIMHIMAFTCCSALLLTYNGFLCACMQAGQRREENGAVICLEHFFSSAKDMMGWLRTALSSASVSADVLRRKDDKIVLPAELPHPKRVRLPVPPSASRAGGGEWQDILTKIFAGQDVANLDELREFESECDDRDVGPILSYYS